MNHPFNFLSKDLLITIFEKLNFQSQTNLKQSCHKFYIDLQITNLYDLPDIFQEKLTDEILLSNQFQKINKLNVSSNENITNNGIKDLINLQKLNISGNKKITDNGIKNLYNLRKLNVSGNKKITDDGIKNLTNLQELIMLFNENI